MLVFQSCKHSVSSHRALSLVLFGRDGVDWVSLFLKGWHGVRRLSPRHWAVMQGRLAVLTIRSEQCAQGCPEEGLITMEQSKKANFRTSLPLTSKCHHRWLGLQHVDLGETNIYSPRRAIMHSAAMKIFVCVFWGLYILIKSFKHFLKKLLRRVWLSPHLHITQASATFNSRQILLQFYSYPLLLLTPFILKQIPVFLSFICKYFSMCL